MKTKSKSFNIKRVTLIVPCFNEEEVLPEFYRRTTEVLDQLSQKNIQTDIIFVDDCSRDNTWAILDKLTCSDPRVRAIRFARNRGHQIAVTAGLDIADGDVVIILDADLQDPPEEIPRLLNIVAEGFDVVHAQRRTRVGETAFKLLTARIFYWILNRLTTIDIVENSGDFRAITRPVVLAVRAFREPHRFLRGMFSAMGFQQTVMQYDRDARFAGETKYPLRKMLRLATDAIFSFSSTPITAIIWCSLGLWCISTVFLVWSGYAHFHGATTAGWTSLVFIMTFFTGLILMSVAIVGLYVGRIFEQGQKRPLYWLDQCRNIDFDSKLNLSAPEMHLSRRVIEAHKT